MGKINYSEAERYFHEFSYKLDWVTEREVEFCLNGLEILSCCSTEKKNNIKINGKYKKCSIIITITPWEIRRLSLKCGN